jgi:hypothetical protein
MITVLSVKLLSNEVTAMPGNYGLNASKPASGLILCAGLIVGGFLILPDAMTVAQAENRLKVQLFRMRVPSDPQPFLFRNGYPKVAESPGNSARKPSENFAWFALLTNESAEPFTLQQDFGAEGYYNALKIEYEDAQGVSHLMTPPNVMGFFSVDPPQNLTLPPGRSCARAFPNSVGTKFLKGVRRARAICQIDQVEPGPHFVHLQLKSPFIDPNDRSTLRNRNAVGLNDKVTTNFVFKLVDVNKAAVSSPNSRSEASD